MEYSKVTPITPRLIIHGGAGNILPSNFPPERYKAYHDSLLEVLTQTHHFLTTPPSFPLLSPNASSTPHSTSALDTVTFAVTLLENNPLFNSGHGAVFTRDGINELEASIMVSRGKKKRGVGIMGLRHVKNPIQLAREMLLHGEEDLDGGNGERRDQIDVSAVGIGAQGHCQLHRYSAEALAKRWGLEMVDPKYFFVQTRWDEHMKGLEKEKLRGCATWDVEDFFPQGTCGAVALDSEGVVACATSTGGLTNKLTGRIGDTPTLGAGFWAQEWEDADSSNTTATTVSQLFPKNSPALMLSDTLKGLLADCFPTPTLYSPLPLQDFTFTSQLRKGEKIVRAVGMSGTGNGDSFLRTDAARTASAIAQYRPKTSLQSAVTEVAGANGELQKSAEERWRKTGEGEGGIIGIELVAVKGQDGEVKRGEGKIVLDFNCGGMFRAYVNDKGKAVVRVWKEGQYDELSSYPWEGQEYDLKSVESEKGIR